MSELERFVMESNAIEGIRREPLAIEIEAHKAVLALDSLSLTDIGQFVSVIAPGHRLRDKAGINVRVGNHRPPPGGPEIARQASELLMAAGNSAVSPYDLHCYYEYLHPFTDGNGRSGRMIWLWQMQRTHGGAPLGFLHHWYYQSLEAMDR